MQTESPVSRPGFPLHHRAHGERCEMSDKKNLKGDDPTLWDLINEHFPEPYRTAYSDPLTVCKMPQASCNLRMSESCLKTNPAGSESYFDRTAVHQMVSDLQQRHPDWRNEDYLSHIRGVKVRGRSLPFEDRTLQKWIAEIVPSKRGRTRGRKNTLKR